MALHTTHTFCEALSPLHSPRPPPLPASASANAAERRALVAPSPHATRCSSRSPMAASPPPPRAAAPLRPSIAPSRPVLAVPTWRMPVCGCEGGLFTQPLVACCHEASQV
jgi:hypothetical protein